MIAKIKIWGKEYELNTVYWGPKGIAHVCFHDENGTYHTIFDDECDFETTVTWEQKNNSRCNVSN